MMKYIIAVLGLLFVSNIQAQNIKIDDANFLQALMQAGVDQNNDNEIQQSEALETVTLFLTGREITNLKGIEAFQNLEKLNCSTNNLLILDVSKNMKLKELDCSDNKLTNIDITANKFLDYFNCAKNNVSKINLTNNPNITFIDCSINKIMELDISQNTNLTRLNCSQNNLHSLDVSKNHQLKILDCSKNFVLKSVCVNQLYSKFEKDTFAIWQCETVAGFNVIQE